MSRKPLRPLALSAAMLLTSALAAQSSIDAIHYKLELELLFNTRSIVGTQTATFASLVNGLKTLELDLDSSLTVNAVKDTSNNPLSYTRPTDKIVITLPKTYNVNEQFTVVVDYSGTPVKSSWGGGMVFTTSGGSPVCWTLSEPWDARMWWPGKDELDDKSTFEMWITHPDTMLAASNGLLQGIDTLSGNRHRSRWETKYPTIPYLISIAVGNYRKRVDTYTHMGANMPVEFYVYPASWTSWQSGMNAIVPMLTAFSDKFGQYPFVNEKYGLAQFTWGGGMEHQTITSQYSAAEWLSAHELGHQWWGDMITCGTWHDIWLNEGFATFCEALWEELKPGGSMALYHSYMAGRKPYRVDGTVYVYNPVSTSQIFSSTNVYRKGGWVVHMLRHTLGEKLFWQALADYRKAFTGKSATTADFVASVSQTVGRDMSWFFGPVGDEEPARPPTTTPGRRCRAVANTSCSCSSTSRRATPTAPSFTMPVDVRVTTEQRHGDARRLER
jgi:aminopeptidase N